jgi:hypothetical protein
MTEDTGAADMAPVAETAESRAQTRVSSGLWPIAVLLTVALIVELVVALGWADAMLGVSR